ncbi:hypothetical protein ACSDQ9_13980 [Aestuariimicrobium soli]|uniref:hypothetical protein n=1 Tax=Aestuariimicrobium soli TaxID=2035834 RepID=UPI003EC1543E
MVSSTANPVAAAMPTTTPPAPGADDAHGGEQYERHHQLGRFLDQTHEQDGRLAEE